MLFRSSGALSLVSLSAQRSIGTAEVNITSCLAYKDVMCDYCVRSCPVHDAIGIVNGRPYVNEQICTGCGNCVASCISEDKGIFVQLPKFED